MGHCKCLSLFLGLSGFSERLRLLLNPTAFSLLRAVLNLDPYMAAIWRSESLGFRIAHDLILWSRRSVITRSLPAFRIACKRKWLACQDRRVDLGISMTLQTSEIPQLRSALAFPLENALCSWSCILSCLISEYSSQGGQFINQMLVTDPIRIRVA